MPQLHPVVERLLHSGKFILRGRSEVFTEHELRGKSPDGGKTPGPVLRTVDRASLEKAAKVCNAKAEAGNLSPIGPGHTFDDVYDSKGQLVRKFPEEDQPQPIGYLYRYEVEPNPHTGKFSLYVDEYVQKVVRDPKSGAMVDGLQYAATFPRRSAEIYHTEGWIDWVAMLRRAPRLDLALENYARGSASDHVLYARNQGSDDPAIIMAKNKTRYSFDTGGEDVDDPTKPPSATPPAPAAAPAAPTAPGAKPPVKDLSADPAHQEAADAYSMHSFGMHPTRSKALMQGMYKEHAAKYGMNAADDMNTEYAMAVPGAAAVAPAVGHTPPAAGTAPANPERPPPPEHIKMQQDQLAIEKTRYEHRLADLESRLAASDAKELNSHMRYELQQMVAEGFEVKAADELTFMETRKYSRAMADDHIAILRRSVPKMPIGDIPPLAADFSRDFRIPAGATPKSEFVTEDEMAKMSRYQRQHPDMLWEDVKQRYNKPNGVPAK